MSMYEIGEYVYIFFREVAIEYINCGKVIDIFIFSYYYGLVFDELTNGQAIMHYSRHRLTA